MSTAARLHGLRHAVRRSTTSSQVKPQMVDKWEVSPDKLTWTFTLRDGLEWHDGKPVTAEDCVASIKRWGAADSMGQKLMASVAELRGARRQDLQDGAEAALRPGAGIAGQVVLQRALHDAQAGRRDRSHHPDQPRTYRLRARSSSRRNGSRARRWSTSRTRTTSRAPSRPRAWPAARSPRSIASNGSGSPTPRRRSRRC